MSRARDVTESDSLKITDAIVGEGGVSVTLFKVFITVEEEKNLMLVIEYCGVINQSICGEKIKSLETLTHSQQIRK
jgi:hypothetical protein